jgi:NADPH:quinone reductase-like Zn-dependent oxidoreductase
MILMQDIQMNIQDESDRLQIEALDEKFVEGTSDYNKLKNKPKLNGNEIIGEVEEIDPTVPLWAKAETRPVYTPEDVGAMAEGSVTNVSTTELDELWNSL